MGHWLQQDASPYWIVMSGPDGRPELTHFVLKHEAKFWSSLGYKVRNATAHTLWIDPKYKIETMKFEEPTK